MQRYFKNNFYKNSDNIKEISNLTKNYLITGDEPKEHGYEIKQTFYGVSLGQVIVLGFGACEGLNGILGLRLSKNFKNIKLIALYDIEKRKSPHVLVKYSKNKKEFYVDIYPKKSYFFSFQENLNLSNKVYKNKYLSYNKNLFKNSFVVKEFDLLSYFKSFLIKIKLMQNKNRIYYEDIAFSYNPQKLYSNISVKNNKKILALKFIDARFEHILGNERNANILYNEILNTNCDYDFCKIVRIIQNRKKYY